MGVFKQVASSPPRKGSVDWSVVDPATVNEKVKVITAEFGKGTDTKFKVDVQLLQYPTAGSTTEPGTGGGETGGGAETASYGDVSAYAEGDEGPTTSEDSDVTNLTPPTGTPIASSKVATVNNLATKAPYYADKITLKKEKAASNLYTGQTAVVATVDFGKNTTYNRDEDVEVEVVNAPKDDSDKQLLTAKIKSGKVELTADKELAPGKYTIRVSQTENSGIPAGAVPASATLQITVVQGIKTIKAASVSTIYVAEKKAGTAKITPIYNNGKKVKTAKVSYAVGKLDENQKFVTDENIAKIVTVKNGTVTVAKGYKADTIAEDEFAVQVKAEDFAENGTTDVAEFTIVTAAQELGDIVLVTKKAESTAADDDISAAYKVVTAGTDGKITITADQASNTYVRVLKSDVAKKDDFAEADFVETDLYTLTFSKKNDVSLNADQSLNAKKVTKDVTIKALTTDGGKKKAANDGKLKFSIDYEKVEAVKLEIVSPGGVSFTNNKAEVTVPTGEIIKVRAVDKDNNAISNKLVDYKITAGKGAKIVGGQNTLEVSVLMSSKEATLKLTNPKGNNPKDVTYTITNANFDQPKAPGVSVKKGSKLYAKKSDTQTLTFTIAKSDPIAAKKVKISAAADDMSQYLLEQITKKEINLADKVISKAATVDFDVNFSDNMNVVKKATLYFDFIGEEGEEGSKKDVILTKTSAAVTVKTELMKKSFKLTNKYTMSAKDTAKVDLTGKATNVEQVEYTSILNANIKGTVNTFTSAFKLEEGKLCLIDEKKAVKDYQETSESKKLNNLIGFVKYTATYKDGSEENFITQLTITVKPSVKKLKATAANVIPAQDMAPVTTVMNRKAPCDLAYAAYKDKEGTIFTINGDSTTYAKGTVTLKLADGVKPPAKGKKQGILTVIPADSMYVAEWEIMNKADGGSGDSGTSTAAATDAEKEAFLKAHAIEVPVTIDVKAVDAAKKVKVETKDSKPSFKDVAASEDGKYTVRVPYTTLISATVNKIDADRTMKKGKPLTPEWISIEEVMSENAFNVIVDKAKYAAAVKEGGQDTKKNYKLNGKAVSATAVFTFKAEGSKPDSIKLTITPPVLAASDIESAVVPPAEENITVEVTPATASIEKGKTQKFEATVKKGNSTVDGATVTWAVAATNNSETLANGTKFNANGNDADTLTIDANETVTNLTVTATYTPTGGGEAVTGKATVTVTEKTEAGGSGA